MSQTLSDNPRANRYEISVDGALAGYVEYRRAGRTIALNHTEINPHFRGRGLAAHVVRFALHHARTEGLSVQSYCSYVRMFIERHGEFSDLVRHETRGPSLTGIPFMGRATVIGALLGALIVLTPVAIMLTHLDGGPMSVAAGAHVGFFGGMGFGGMLGAVVQADRTERKRRVTHSALPDLATAA